MAAESKKPVSEADRSAARVAARKAKMNHDRSLRGNRDLTSQEKYAIETLRLAAKACDVAIESINQGGGSTAIRVPLRVSYVSVTIGASANGQCRLSALRFDSIKPALLFSRAGLFIWCFRITP